MYEQRMSDASRFLRESPRRCRFGIDFRAIRELIRGLNSSETRNVWQHTYNPKSHLERGTTRKKREVEPIIGDYSPQIRAFCQTYSRENGLLRGVFRKSVPKITHRGNLRSTRNKVRWRVVVKRKKNTKCWKEFARKKSRAKIWYYIRKLSARRWLNFSCLYCW